MRSLGLHRGDESCLRDHDWIELNAALEVDVTLPLFLFRYLIASAQHDLGRLGLCISP